MRLFPLWMVAGVALVTKSKLAGFVAAAVSGWIVFPLMAHHMHARSRAAESVSRDPETDYWLR